MLGDNVRVLLRGIEKDECVGVVVTTDRLMLAKLRLRRQTGQFGLTLEATKSEDTSIEVIFTLRDAIIRVTLNVGC